MPAGFQYYVMLSQSADRLKPYGGRVGPEEEQIELDDKFRQRVSEGWSKSAEAFWGGLGAVSDRLIQDRHFRL